MGALVGGAAPAQPPPPLDSGAQQVCARPMPGSLIEEPAQLRSRNGELRVALTITSRTDEQGHTRYCYFDAAGHQAPTLRVQPGDLLTLTLRNRITAPAGSGASANPAPGRDPCDGGPMSAFSTNLHFHGLAVPPVCHQDETLHTLLQPGDLPFEYRVRIGAGQPPGLYWYHPHVHGFSEEHLLGGASGAIVVEGTERLVPEAKNLPERILVVRDERMGSTAAGIPSDLQRPTKQLSINYVPVHYPRYLPGRLQMQPGARELWRVLNASADTYLYLYLEYSGTRQLLGLVALDGAPLGTAQRSAQPRVRQTTFVFMPPGARAEFIVQAPPAGVTGRLLTGYVDRGGGDEAPASRPGAQGPDTGDHDPLRPLAEISVAAEARRPQTARSSSAIANAKVSAPLATLHPLHQRRLYFSEAPAPPGDPNGPTLFFITEEGRPPAVFDPGRTQADITVRQGAVEDWTIENRSREVHTFHIHQLHFVVVARAGQALSEPDLLDTVNLAAWRGYAAYPSITLRMDFRDPRIVGLFPFHCHIAQHLDGGMMGTVRVLPANAPRSLPASP
jgi:FtsP/CotA-like multicopper oxidase with cupredoxin domain